METILILLLLLVYTAVAGFLVFVLPCWIFFWVLTIILNNTNSLD